MTAPTVVLSRATRPLWGRFTPDATTLLATLLLAFIAFIVLYPMVLLFLNSFRVGVFGTELTWGLGNWEIALTQPRMLSALQNTFTLAITRQALGTGIGIILAWLLARTNLPFRNWIEVGFWFTLLLPNLPILLGWILLLDGSYGILVNGVRKIPGLEGFQFEIFSWWGIVVAHLMITLIPLKVFLLTPAFRNVNASLEEASRTSGASEFRTLFQIVVPMLAPTILFVTLLGIIRSMQSFEIELILGGAAGIDVYSTLVYREVMQSPPRYGSATALSMIVIACMVPFIVAQQQFVARRSYATVAGQYAQRVYNLGRARWPLFACMVGLLAFIFVLPTTFMVMGSFMKVFGNFNIPEPWTMNNWQRVLKDTGLTKAMMNTLYIGLGSTVLSLTLFTIIAYISVRSRFFGRRLLDFLTWLPSTIPGIVTSLGLLWLFIGTPIFRPLYGTTWILITALGIGGMTLGVQLIKVALLQLGNELEEAAWVAGANRGRTLWQVLIPLMAPTMAVVALLQFAAAVSAVSLVALLGSSSNKPLSLLQLEYMDTGLFEPASVIGIIIYLVTIAAAVLARIIGLRAGLGRFGGGG